ncbi:cupin domain-containing protein [Variovorax sp. dw_308]|uniref:cupin domain-containing protein n=1 Tax=Variovorax sp. dw_308 TaxID=2721546 RepID=UPI00210C176D|nr:cupin domain-containing protein [Variovorax sp. dw_308]
MPRSSSIPEAPRSCSRRETGLHSSGAGLLDFDEVLVRAWPPGQVVGTHSHPFAVKALVVQGEMWLTEGGDTRPLKPGDSFEPGYAAPHAERYGSKGAVYWAARRNTRPD